MTRTRKLTESEIADVREAKRNGANAHSLAGKYGVNVRAIYRYCKGLPRSKTQVSKVDRERFAQLIAEGKRPYEIASILDCSRTLVYQMAVDMNMRFGRGRLRVTEGELRALVRDNVPVKDIAKRLGCSLAYAYKMLYRYGIERNVRRSEPKPFTGAHAKLAVRLYHEHRCCAANIAEMIGCDARDVAYYLYKEMRLTKYAKRLTRERIKELKNDLVLSN